MNAQEARIQAKEKNINEANSQYSRAMLCIEKAANNGLYECWFYESILNDVRDKLTIVDGYKVGSNQSDRGEELVKISWK